MENHSQKSRNLIISNLERIEGSLNILKAYANGEKMEITEKLITEERKLEGPRYEDVILAENDLQIYLRNLTQEFNDIRREYRELSEKCFLCHKGGRE